MTKQNTELATLVINQNGKLAFEISTAPEALSFLAALFTQIQSLPQANTSDLRSRKRNGGGFNIESLLVHNQTNYSETKQPRKRIKAPVFNLKQKRELEELIYSIDDAVQGFWELTRRSRKAESKSAAYKKLYDLFEAETEYRAERARTLGSINAGSLVLHSLVLDGKGREFQTYVSRLTRGIKAGTVMV